MIKISRTQRDLIEILKNRVNAYTLDQIAQILGLASKSTVHYHIKQLIKKGYIKFNSDNPTNYTIVDQGGYGVAYLPVFETQGVKMVIIRLITLLMRFQFQPKSSNLIRKTLFPSR